MGGSNIIMNNNGNLYPTGKRGTHLAHLNLQSLNNKFELVKIQIRELGFHIFTFSESWLTCNIPDTLVNIEGYNIIRLDRNWKEDGKVGVKKGGGVGFYIRDDLTYSQDGLQQYNVSCKDIECSWLRLLNSNAKDIILCVVYRPPSGNVETFCNTLVKTMEEIGNNFNNEIIIMGDFNINYLDKNDIHTKLLAQMELNTGLKQQIIDPTRGANVIDLIFTNSQDVANSGVINLNISDHDLIFVTKKKETKKRRQVSFKGRSYRNYNKETLQNYLRETNWDEFWLLTDPNDCWGYIHRTIKLELDRMCPLKERKVKQSNEPWLTNGILEAIHDKDQAWKLAKRTGNEEDVARARRLRNSVKDIIRRAKKDFIQEELVRDETAPKKFWEKINHLLPSKDSGNSIRLMDKENKVIIEEKALPDYVNTFFTGIGPKLANKFSDDWTADLPAFHGDKIGQIHIDLGEVEKLVKDINTCKASSVKFISATVLKDAFSVITRQLCFMYNLSFTSGIFPDDWKIANVIPLRKGGDSMDVNNLRPVSLLPLPGKLAERLMHTHVSKFVEENGLITDKQGGFRKGRSTIATVADLTDEVLLGLNSKEYTLASFIDLKKAFDTINHRILLKKLPFFGLNNSIINWIGNYLTNRSQRCTVNGTTSGELAITCGVPQGSILGPLLFLLYVNDVNTNLLHTNVLLYADDTVIFAKHEDEGMAHLWVSMDLFLLQKWCNRNQLTINLAKTKLMLFGTKNMLKRSRKQDICLSGMKLRKAVQLFGYEIRGHTNV